jgi:selenocysteine-specific elongation factor
LPGDRFIIRQFSPVVTIGGGTVLDAAPMSRSFTPDRLIEVLATGEPPAVLKARIERRTHDGISIAGLVAETGWTEKMIVSQLATAVKGREVIRINDLFLIATAWDELKKQIVPFLQEFHRKNPLVSGISREELRIRSNAGEAIFQALLQTLAQEKKVEVSGDLVRLPGLGVVMKDEEADSKKKIEDAFAVAGLKVPALHEVLASLTVDKVRAQKIVTLLLRDKVLVKVSDELVFHRSALEALRRQMAAQKAKAPKIDVAGFKEMTGVSRKYAIPLLEYLDRERVTKRVGDAREIL